MTAPRILVVEDGFEYTHALERIAEGRAELVRAGDVAEAVRATDDGSFAAVLLDVVFDRIEPQRLAGAGSGRSTEHLARQQGFYIADALAPRLAKTRVLMAYDFTEIGRAHV